MGAVRFHALASGAAITCAVMMACSSFSSSPTESPDPDAAADPDAAVANDAPSEGAIDAPVLVDAGDDATVNLLPNPDFETLGCGGWSTAPGSLGEEHDPPYVHGGVGACRVCAIGGGVFTVYGDVLVDAPAGSRFFGGAWIRNAPTGSVPPTINVELHVHNASDQSIQDGTPTASMVSSEWQKASALVELAQPGARVALLITSTTPGSCLTIDDAWLYRTK